MNCSNHPTENAIALCIDCNKGLCFHCATMHTIPICEYCKEKRIRIERLQIIHEMSLTYAMGFTLGFLFAWWQNRGLTINLGHWLVSYGIGIYIFSSFIPGWRFLTRITPPFFLLLPMRTWILLFILKAILAFGVGLFVLPIKTLKNIYRLILLSKAVKKKGRL